MTAEYEIKKHILLELKKSEDDFPFIDDLETESSLNYHWNALCDDDQWDDLVQDAMDIFRESFSHRTEIKADYSRHYDSTSVAAQLSNGKWVGWIYWSGGGKHGEPGSIDWIEDAYFLKAIPKVVTTFDFKKEEEP